MTSVSNPRIREDNPPEIDRESETTPTACEILPVDADRADWIAARRQGLGGSDALAVLGLSPYTSRLSLYFDKRDELPASPPTTAMELGVLLEPVVAELFARRSGLRLDHVGTFAHTARSWQHANPDRFSSDGGVVEIKTTSGFSADADQWAAGHVPDHAECQIQHYLAVTGRSHGWAVALIDGRHLYWQRVDRDDEFGALLTRQESAFWFDHVHAGVPPEPDDSEHTKRLLARRYRHAESGSETLLGEQIPDLLAEHRDCKATAKEADRRAREIENQVKSELGDAEWGLGPDGSRIARWRPQTRRDIDRDRLKREYPLVADDVTTSTTLRVFVNHAPEITAHADETGGQ